MDPCGSDDEIEGPAKGGASRLGLRAMIPGRLFRSKTRDPPRDAKEGGKEGREGGKGAEKSLPASNSPQAQTGGLRIMIKRVFRKGGGEDGEDGEDEEGEEGQEERAFEVELSPLPKNIPRMFSSGRGRHAGEPRELATAWESEQGQEEEQQQGQGEEEDPSPCAALPDEMLLECLVRIPRSTIGSAARVCRTWRAIIQSDTYAEYREALGLMDNFLFVFSNVTVAAPPPSVARGPEASSSSGEGGRERRGERGNERGGERASGSGNQGGGSGGGGGYTHHTKAGVPIQYHPQQLERVGHHMPEPGTEANGHPQQQQQHSHQPHPQPGAHASVAGSSSGGAHSEPSAPRHRRAGQGLGALKARADAVMQSAAPQQIQLPPPPETRLLIQVFHIRKNKWLKRVDVPAGPIRIDDFSQCLTLEGLPVIFPGILAKKQAPLRYIPWSNSFRRMAPLLVPRYKFVGGEMGGRLYVAGGMREQALEGDVDKKDLRSAEVYNPATRMWQALPDMHFLRYGAVGGCSERRLFVIGGTRSHLQFRAGAAQQSVEYLDADVAQGLVDSTSGDGAPDLGSDQGSPGEKDPHAISSPTLTPTPTPVSTPSSATGQIQGADPGEACAVQSGGGAEESKALGHAEKRGDGREVKSPWHLREPLPQMGLVLGAVVLGSSVFVLRNEEHRGISWIRYNSKRNDWKPMHDVPGISPDPRILASVEFKLVAYRAKILIVQVRGNYGDVQPQAAASAKRRPLVLLYNPKGEGASLYKRMADVPVVCQGAICAMVRC